MNALKIIGKIGAGLLGLGGLILAGKAGFGENLKFGRDDEELPPVMAPDDDSDGVVDEIPVEVTETTEEEVSDE